MGILKLTTFMKCNPQLTDEFRLYATKVVIDGNSLYHFLYHKDNLDFLHGGDYDQYALKVREFFSLFHTCNIQPYVVLDGGNKPNDIKFETILKRMKHRLELVNRLAKNQRNSDNLIPMAFDTFKAVLQEINMPLAVCDFEADKEIGLLANKLNCPVLSNDSDFYILPLTAGFIPFDCVQLTLPEIRVETESSEHYLLARIYHVDNFVKKISSLDRKVLTLLATFLGNDRDFVNTNMFKSFYSLIEKLKGETKFNIPKFHDKTLKVILWLLKVKTYDEVMSTIKSIESSHDKETILSALEIITKAFTFNETENESFLYSFFFSAVKYCQKNKTWFNGSIIPNWYVCQHRQGNLPPRSIDTITLHRTFLTPQVENRKSPASSYQCSEKLRAFMYGILLSEDIAVLDLKK